MSFVATHRCLADVQCRDDALPHDTWRWPCSPITHPYHTPAVHWCPVACKPEPVNVTAASSAVVASSPPRGIEFRAWARGQLDWPFPSGRARRVGCCSACSRGCWTQPLGILAQERRAKVARHVWWRYPRGQDTNVEPVDPYKCRNRCWNRCCRSCGRDSQHRSLGRVCSPFHIARSVPCISSRDNRRLRGCCATGSRCHRVPRGRGPRRTVALPVRGPSGSACTHVALLPVGPQGRCSGTGGRLARTTGPGH